MPSLKKNFLFYNSRTNQVYLIFLIFIFFRFFFFFLFNFESSFYLGDSIYYIDVANNILKNKIHSDNFGNLFYRPPLYPFLLSFLLLISKNYIFFYIFQSFLFLLFTIFFYYFLSKINFKFSFLVAILVSINPSDIIYNGRILTETLTTILLISTTILFFYFDSYKSYIIAGILLGLIALTKDFYLYLIFPFIFIGIIKKIKLKYLLLNILTFILILSPWFYRNFSLHEGDFFLSKGLFWSNLWVGTWLTNPSEFTLTEEDIRNHNSVYLKKYNFELSQNEIVKIIYDRVDNQDFFKKITLNYIYNNPFETLKTWIVRYPFLWIGSRTDLVFWKIKNTSYLWYILKLIFYIFSSLVVFFGFLGIILNIIRFDDKKYLLVPIFYHAILYVPFYNIESRYTQPIFVLMIFYSLYFCDYFYKKVIKR